MNNYKPFGDYLIELIKIITFGAALVWLCSCNNNRERAISLIHAYTDTIVNASRQRLMAQWAIDSLRRGYSSKYPIQLFKPAQYSERAKWRQQESEAYMRMTRACTEYKIKKIMAESKVVEYQRKIDSLKIELYR